MAFAYAVFAQFLSLEVAALLEKNDSYHNQIPISTVVSQGSVIIIHPDYISSVYHSNSISYTVYPRSILGG